MMLPCCETYERMVGAHVGVWPELVHNGTIELAIKLSADLAKAVLKGAPVTLITAVVSSAGQKVRVVGVRIEDDKNDPAFVHGPQEVYREQRNFERLLESESTYVTLFDELVRPIAAGRVRWNPDQARIILGHLKHTLPHYEGHHRRLLIAAMNTAEESVGKWHRNDGSPEANVWAMPLHFESLHSINVSSPEAGTFTLNDPDEGGGLETSAYLLLEANYRGTSHLNPQLGDGAKRREFCDVLVVGEKEVFIIQSKVMPMLKGKLDQTTERRVRNVCSNFQKALRQLCGSVRRLRQGQAIYTNEGAEIRIDETSKELIHGIVLLSSTNLALPWPKISQELFAASRKSRAKFHVLDFGELQQHVAFGRTLDEMSLHLSGRYEISKESGNANVRSRFLDEETRPIKSERIDNDADGYVFAIAVDRGRKNDAGRIFNIFKAVIKSRRFTGRCEYFQDVRLLKGERFCWIGLGLQWQREDDSTPSCDWWIEFYEQIRALLDVEPGLKLTGLSRMEKLGDIRASQTLAMVIEFVNGMAVGYLDPDNPQGEQS